MTFREIYEKFKKETGIEDSMINDYRPCIPLYDVPPIPNAIVIWLESGGKIIYINEWTKKMNHNSSELK